MCVIGMFLTKDMCQEQFPIKKNVQVLFSEIDGYNCFKRDVPHEAIDTKLRSKL